MSHLGDLLSALVDGELTGAELDRANAHIAVCGACRVEASALRSLKQELRSLSEASVAGGTDDFTRRLLEMSAQADQDGQIPARYLGRSGAPYSTAPPRRRQLTRGQRVRYLLWSAVSLVVLGIGSLAFGLGGGTGSAGPQITPQLEVFDVQHALFSGDVPFADPTHDVTPRIPEVAGTP